MASELIYASVARGMRPGTSGYCTVAHTRGLALTTVARLEALSAFGGAAQGGPSYAVRRLTLDGVPRVVLSRIGPAGLDYSRRPSKIAHHVVLDAAERPSCGPLPLLLDAALMKQRYDAPPGLLAPLTILGDYPDPECDEQTTAHGTRLLAVLRSAPAPIRVSVAPSIDLMAALRTVFKSLDLRERWTITFDTAFERLPAGSDCAWRFVRGQMAAEDVARVL